jgi:hypothetical protein
MNYNSLFKREVWESRVDRLMRMGLYEQRWYFNEYDRISLIFVGCLRMHCTLRSLDGLVHCME